MHHLLVSVFAFMFSFGHAQTVRHAEADTFIPPVQQATGFEYAIPGRHDVPVKTAMLEKHVVAPR